jgi:hypothetical protein
MCAESLKNGLPDADIEVKKARSADILGGRRSRPG